MQLRNPVLFLAESTDLTVNAEEAGTTSSPNIMMSAATLMLNIGALHLTPPPPSATI